jgi:hypothetical protein
VQLLAQLSSIMVWSMAENVSLLTTNFSPSLLTDNLGYCGNAIAPAVNGAILAPNPADCSVPCPGNATEMCGGGNRLNLYKNLNVVVPTTPVGPGPAPSPPPAAPVGKYNPIGCYAEPAGGRALTPGAYANDSMTAEMCGALCGPKYQYFGMEYGREVCIPMFRL